MNAHVVAITADGNKGDGRANAGVGADSMLGLRGEDRFAVIDSAVRPGEAPTRSCFPFSFFICRLLEDLKTSTIRGTPEILVSARGDEEVIVGEFALLQLGSRIHGVLSRSMMNGNGNDGEGACDENDTWSRDEDLLRDYLHDFTCLMLPSVRGISRTGQARYVLMLLDLAGPGSAEDGKRATEGVEGGYLPEAATGRILQWTPTTSLATVHQRFWRAEYAIRTHLDLLGAAGVSCFREVINIAGERLKDAVSRRDEKSTLCHLDGILHLRVARAAQESVLQCLRSISLVGNGSNESDVESWATRLDVLDSLTSELLAACTASCRGDSYGEELLAELVEGAEKLQFVRKLLLEVIHALEVPKELLSEVLAPLTEMTYPLRSERFLQSVMEVLSLLIERRPSRSRRVGQNGAFASSRGNHQSVASESDPWETLPRFLEYYLSEILVGATEAEKRVGHALWRKLVALLSADVDILRQGGWPEQILRHPVFPTEAASARILRRIRNGNMPDVVRAVTTGLEEAFQSAGRLDNQLAACFVAAVEDDTSAEEVISETLGQIVEYEVFAIFPVPRVPLLRSTRYF